MTGHVRFYDSLKLVIESKIKLLNRYNRGRKFNLQNSEFISSGRLRESGELQCPLGDEVDIDIITQLSPKKSI